MDFSRFDKAIDNEQFKKDYEDAIKNGGTGDYEEVPAGTYVVKIESMEIGATKEKGEPIFKAMCRIVEDDDHDGKFKKHCIFFNRKIYGNKETDKWNDAKAIGTVTGWLDKLETDTVPVFENYSQFSELVMDIMEEVEQDKLLLEVEYDKDNFNPIHIEEVFEEE